MDIYLREVCLQKDGILTECAGYQADGSRTIEITDEEERTRNPKEMIK